MSFFLLFMFGLSSSAQTLLELGVPQCLDAVSNVSVSNDGITKRDLNGKPYYVVRLDSQDGFGKFAVISASGNWARVYMVNSRQQTKGIIKLDSGTVSMDFPDKGILSMPGEKAQPYKEEVIAHNQLRDLVRERIRGKMLLYLRGPSFIENTLGGKEPAYRNRYEGVRNVLEWLRRNNFSECEKAMGKDLQELICENYMIAGFVIAQYKQRSAEEGQRVERNDEMSCYGAFDGGLVNYDKYGKTKTAK